jgi:chromosome segregation ATPase
MTDAHTRIDSLKEDIREIGYSVLDLQAKAAAHDAKLEQVLATQLAHEARFDHIDVRLDGLETRFDGLETRFDGLETRFDGFEASVDRQFASQDSRFDRIDALLAEVLSRLADRPQ